MLVAVAICMIIVGLFIIRKLAPLQTENKKMRIFLIVLGAVFFVGGGAFWWLVGTGRIGVS